MQSTEIKYTLQYWLDKSRGIFVDKDGFIRAPNNIVEGSLNVAKVKGVILHVDEETWDKPRATLAHGEVKTPDNLLVTEDLRIKAEYPQTGDNLIVLGNLCLENMLKGISLDDEETWQKFSEIKMGKKPTIGKIFYITHKTFLRTLPENTIAVGLVVKGCNTLETLPESLKLLLGGRFVKSPLIKKLKSNIAVCHRNDIRAAIERRLKEELIDFSRTVDKLVGTCKNFVLQNKDELYNPNVKIWINRERDIYLDHNDVLCIPDDISEVDLYISKLRSVGTVESTREGFDINQRLERVVIKRHLFAKGEFFIKAKKIIIIDGLTVKTNIKLANTKVRQTKASKAESSKLDEEFISLKGDFYIGGIWYLGRETDITELPENVIMGGMISRNCRAKFNLHNSIKIVHGGVLSRSLNMQADEKRLAEMNVIRTEDVYSIKMFENRFNSIGNCNNESDYTSEKYQSEQNEYSSVYSNSVDNPLLEHHGF